MLFFKPVKFRIWSEISILCDIEGITISIQHSFIECSKLPAVATLYRLFNEVISRYCKKTHTIFFETIYFVRFHITTIIFCFKSWIWILSELVRLLMFRLLKYLKIILVNFGLCWICVLSERKKKNEVHLNRIGIKIHLEISKLNVPIHKFLMGRSKNGHCDKKFPFFFAINRKSVS